MHIITDDNINQLESMNFSKNISFCTGLTDATPQVLIEQIQKSLSNKTNARKSILETSIEEEYKNSNKFPNVGMTPEEVDLALLMARDDARIQGPKFDINAILDKKRTPQSPDFPPPPPVLLPEPHVSAEYAQGSPAYTQWDDTKYGPPYDAISVRMAYNAQESPPKI